MLCYKCCLCWLTFKSPTLVRLTQVLPQWKALNMSTHPVAVEVADMSKVEAILQGTRVKVCQRRGWRRGRERRKGLWIWGP